MQEKGLGTFAVFMTAISTILGAILFLRFGFAVAHVGLLSTLAIILLGHHVTIPTALAVAEIATNQKVEGGGAYYMISRSFGLSIGGAIGIALFLSQAISVAFYIIAFTVSTRDLLTWLEVDHGIVLEPWMVNYGFMSLLTLLMLTKGAQVGVKALYGVVAVLVVALVSFFAGAGEPQSQLDILRTIDSTMVTADGRTVERFSFIEVFREPLWLALPLDHRLGEKERLAPADLQGLTILALEPGHSLHVILGMWMEGWGMELSETVLVTANGCRCLTDFARSVHVVD